MSTNVKPGDLARVVAPYEWPGRGAFVIVGRRANAVEQFGPVSYAVNEPSWVCDGWVRSVLGFYEGPQVVIADCCLRPVRPEPQEIDEMITIAGPAPEHGRIREWEGEA